MFVVDQVRVDESPSLIEVGETPIETLAAQVIGVDTGGATGTVTAQVSLPFGLAVVRVKICVLAITTVVEPLEATAPIVGLIDVEVEFIVDQTSFTLPPPTGKLVGVAVKDSHFGSTVTGLSVTVSVALQMSC